MEDMVTQFIEYVGTIFLVCTVIFKIMNQSNKRRKNSSKPTFRSWNKPIQGQLQGQRQPVNAMVGKHTADVNPDDAKRLFLKVPPPSEGLEKEKKTKGWTKRTVTKQGQQIPLFPSSPSAKLSVKDLTRAMVWSEIVGLPRAKKKFMKRM